jgi:hypothetical protein
VTKSGKKPTKAQRLFRSKEGRTREEHLKWVDDVLRETSIGVTQFEGWLRSLAETAASISLQGMSVDPAQVAVFWIRLYGALREIRARFQRGAEQASPEWKVRYATMLAQMDAVAGALTKDEKVYLDYRRQVECHPLQHAFAAMGEHGGERITVEVRLFGIEMPRAEWDATIQRVLDADGKDEHAIGVRVASHLHPHLGRLLSAYREFAAMLPRYPRR